MVFVRAILEGTFDRATWAGLLGSATLRPLLALPLPAGETTLPSFCVLTLALEYTHTPERGSVVLSFITLISFSHMIKVVLFYEFYTMRILIEFAR